MRLKLFILSVVAGIVFGLSGYLRAESTVTQITNNSYEDKFPQIRGNYLVWQGYWDGDWEIFLYNTASAQTTQVTDNDYDDTCPKTDGTYVVWQGFKDSEWDIFLWDGSQTQAISDQNAEDCSPEIANGLVVWTSGPFGSDFSSPKEIISYDLGSKTLVTLSELVDSDNTLDDISPKIDDRLIVWVQTDEDDNAELILYDHDVGSIIENQGYIWTNDSLKDGNLNVLTRHIGKDTEIFLYNTTSRKYHQITDNDIEDTYPSISGNHMAWMGGEGRATEIYIGTYKCLALTKPADKAVLSKTRSQSFTWEAITYDRFKVQFSNDPRFPSGDTLTLPSGEDTWLSEITFAPAETEWQEIETILKTHGYWRVEGEDGAGDSAFSGTRSLTIEEGASASTDIEAEDTEPDIAAGRGRDREDSVGGGWCFIDTAARSLSW